MSEELSRAAAYTIDGGVPGKARLDVLARVCGPYTDALLDRLCISTGARCVDLGCGGGHVSRELARRVGAGGSVVGIDVDRTVLALAREDALLAGMANVEFRCEDASRFAAARYDIAYARFLLSHLADPARAVDAMVGTLRPGGRVVVENIDFSVRFCHPSCHAYEQYFEIYRETVRRRGGDPVLGPRLPSLLVDAGLDGVEAVAYQPCASRGDVKLLNVLTLERITDAVVEEGVLRREELDALVARAIRVLLRSDDADGRPTDCASVGHAAGLSAARKGCEGAYDLTVFGGWPGWSRAMTASGQDRWERAART